MKEYRLKAWAELPAPFQSTAHRRMLSNLSHRHMSMNELMACSGARRQEVQLLLDALGSRDLLLERELFLSNTLLSSVRPVGNWIRRKLNLPDSSR